MILVILSIHKFQNFEKNIDKKEIKKQAKKGKNDGRNQMESKDGSGGRGERKF